MRLDLYQQETKQLTLKQLELLEEVTARLGAGESLSDLEDNGMLHALQILIENAIGKAKQILKSKKITAPVSAYDTFSELISCDVLPAEKLSAWNAIIGLRNAIVHDYMNINIPEVYKVVSGRRYKIIAEFLLQPMPKD